MRPGIRNSVDVPYIALVPQGGYGITVYPESRMELQLRYRYDYERALSFADAVAQLHSLPENLLPKEVA